LKRHDLSCADEGNQIHRVLLAAEAHLPVHSFERARLQSCHKHRPKN
jgi:hypothetical protein